ncbi:MAG: HNH endonuclease [Anaerolineae bacterium]|nr:HNH endonuclease [Anaerolineae bacterium]
MSDARITSELRKFVINRAHGCCEYCLSQSQFATQSFSVEHIRPVSKDGLSTEDNLALSCQGCNNHKYNKTENYDPVTIQKVPLFHPRQQKWSDHFVWNDDYSLIIGITPTGRATVETFHLNREGIVNLRKALYQTGQHPPF